MAQTDKTAFMRPYWIQSTFMRRNMKPTIILGLFCAILGVVSTQGVWAGTTEFDVQVVGEPELEQISVLGTFQASMLVRLRIPTEKGAHRAGIMYRFSSTRSLWNQESVAVSAAENEGHVVVLVVFPPSEATFTNQTIEFIPWVDFIPGRTFGHNMERATFVEPTLVVREHSAAIQGTPWFFEKNYNASFDETFIAGLVNIRVVPARHPGYSVVAKLKFDSASDWLVVPAVWSGDAERNGLDIYSHWKAEYSATIKGKVSSVKIQIVAHRREHWPLKGRLGRVAPRPFETNEISEWPVEVTKIFPTRK